MGNIALNKTTAASSYVMPYTSSRAVDGQYTAMTPTSRWLCNTLPCWFIVDIGATYLVNRWVVRHMPSAGWRLPDYVNSDFKLQGSNDSVNWHDLDTVVGNSLAITDRTLAYPVQYRLFRLYCTKGLRCNNQMTSIMEIEIYQTYSTQLTGLSISSGTLTPAFNSSTLDYTASVGPDVTSINVTPTALSPTAAIKVNATTAISGGSVSVPLNYGDNAITVSVSDGGALQNYTIVVTRQNSVYLSSLTAQSGSGEIQLTPTFAKATANYTSSVAYSVTSVIFTPTTENPSATIKINGTEVKSGQTSSSFNLSEGDNTFNIVVTSGGTSFTYSVVISRAYNLLLTKTVIDYVYRGGTGSSTITMDSSTEDYTINLLNNPSSMTVTPYTASPNTVVKVNGTIVPSGSPSASMSVTSGMKVTITVSSPDETQVRTYTITVTK